MAVKIRERPKGSGFWWILIDHHGKRKAKKIGTEKHLAKEIAKKIEAKLILGEWEIDQESAKPPTFKECAQLWLLMPHDWKESTRESYEFNLKKHALPYFAKTSINEISRKDLKNFFDIKYTEG